MRTVLREERSGQDAAAARPKAFSSVGSTEAERLLEGLSFVEVDGNAMEPIDVPSTCPECEPFDYSRFVDEEHGTNACLDHHQTQLVKLGIRFGRDAFKMYDLHKKQQLYLIRTKSGQQYSGNVDGCLAPFGLMANSAANQCRIIFEHKQSSKQKEQWRDSDPSQVRGRTHLLYMLCHVLYHLTLHCLLYRLLHLLGLDVQGTCPSAEAKRAKYSLQCWRPTHTTPTP
jgi:hypothetical protein